MSKVASIRGADSALGGAVVDVPNKMIGGDSMLEKLARALSTVVSEREKNLRVVHDAKGVLSEAPPPAPDNEAAGRAVAQARVDDLMTGGSTADTVAADFDKARAAAEDAIAKHERRLAEARQQLEQSNSFLQALTAQGVEIDKAVRKELALFAAEKSDEAADDLSLSVTRYFEDFINYRAARWLQGIQGFGDKGKQFWPADSEMDLLFAVPDEYADMLPEGWVRSATPGVVVFKSYTVKQFVQKRGLEIMHGQTSGLYPEVAADLPRQQDS